MQYVGLKRLCCILLVGSLVSQLEGVWILSKDGTLFIGSPWTEEIVTEEIELPAGETYKDEHAPLTRKNKQKKICILNVGCLSVNGSFLVNGPQTINGGLTINGNLIVNGNETITNNLIVEGNETIDGNLIVNGCITAPCINGQPAGGGVFNDSMFAIVHTTDTTKQVHFSVGGTPATITTFVTNPTVSRNLIMPDVDGTVLASDTATGEVWINQTGPLHGSNSGVQYSSTFPSRAQYRVNQYGNNAGVPGISSFKSRGATIGSSAPVHVGDIIFRDTAVGVTSNLSIPLSGFISIIVTSVPAGQGFT